MADTNKITYVSLDNLKYYDQKNKRYIADADKAVKDALEGQLDVFGQALDGEIARAKGEEAKNAAAAATAQAKGEEALAHSEALAGKVGTVADGKTIVGMIQDVVDSAYNDTEVRGLISDLASNKADKTQVASDIANAVKAEEDARKVAVEALTTTVGQNKTAIEGTVSTLEQKVDANEEDIENKMTALTGRVGATETAVNTTLPGLINDEKAAREQADEALAADIKEISDDYLKAADKTELEGKITANTNALATLNGDGDGSVKKAIDDAINKFATDVTNDDVVNSYKELINWAAEHGGEAAEMVEAIEANETAIGELETFIGSLPEGATVSTVIAYIEKLVADEKARAEQAEGGLDTRLQAVEAKVTGTGDGSVAKQIEAAKQAAIDAASADATSKANTAEANAKSHADTEVGKDRVRLDALEADKHTHANKLLLDTYTQSEANLADAVAKKHEHANKAELDLIQSGDKAKWDAAEQNAKDFATGLNNAMDAKVGAVSDRVTELETFVDSIEFCTTEDIDGLFD